MQLLYVTIFMGAVSSGRVCVWPLSHSDAVLYERSKAEKAKVK
jgi:hypothetical protein